MPLSCPALRAWSRLGPIVLALALVPSGAAAQEDGVFVDPGSPAGKEYAIPFEQARGEGAGGSKDRGGRGAPAPLFGVGISSTGGRGGGSSQAGGSQDGSSPGGGSDASGREGSGAPGTGKPGGRGTAGRAAVATSTDGGVSPTAQVGGVVAGVVLLGGLLALLLRRFAAGERE
jgi:hypothetical protein